MTEFGPTPRSAGRYCGSAAEAGLAEGFAAGEPAGLGARDAAGLEGVAEGFTCTCTSAAKTIPVAVTAAAKVNQNLNIESLRNAVPRVSQDQFFRRPRDRGAETHFLCDLFPCEFPGLGGRAKEREREWERLAFSLGFTLCS